MPEVIKKRRDKKPDSITIDKRLSWFVYLFVICLSCAIQVQQLAVFFGDIILSGSNGLVARFFSRFDSFLEPARGSVSRSKGSEQNRFAPLRQRAGALCQLHSFWTVSDVRVRCRCENPGQII